MLLLIVDKPIELQAGIPNHCGVFFEVTIPDWLVNILGDSVVAGDTELLRVLERFKFIEVYFVQDVEDGGDAVVFQLLVVLLLVREGTERDRQLADLLVEEIVDKIAIGLEDGAVDPPDLLGIPLDARVVGAETTSILVRLLLVDPPQISFNDHVTRPRVAHAVLVLQKRVVNV